jgi:DNA-binding transcriptional LysR family regulator
MTEPNWDLYRSFLAVMREQSLSAAARAVRSTQPTLGRHIAELEQALGVALFTRSHRGLVPTEAAHALVASAQMMESAARAAVRGAVADAEAVRGVVRLTASEVVGAEVLPAMLAGFCEAHPETAIELVLNNRVEDLLQREADIAVRMTQPVQGALLARRVGRVELGFHARRDYLDRHGRPDGLESLLASRLIGFDRSRVSVDSLGAGMPPLTPDLFALRTDSDLAQLAAIRAGFGVGGCQTPLARRSPDLERVAPQLAFHLDLWLVMHEDLKGVRRMRLLFDHLAEALAAYADS